MVSVIVCTCWIAGGEWDALVDGQKQDLRQCSLPLNEHQFAATRDCAADWLEVSSDVLELMAVAPPQSCVSVVQKSGETVAHVESPTGSHIAVFRAKRWAVLVEVGEDIKGHCPDIGTFVEDFGCGPYVPDK